MKVQAPQSSPTVRWINGILAAVYFVVFGMLVYFRLVPFQRVMSRFESEGTGFPVWFGFIFTMGVVLVALLLLWRGVTTLRKALRP